MRPKAKRVKKESARKLPPEQEKPRWARILWENVKSYGLLIAVLLFVRSVVIQATVVPTTSMENTILVGDHLFLDKILYGPQIPLTPFRLPAIKPYQRGDVIAFRSPVDPSIVLVKRLIGMPGDTIQIKHKRLYRNGALIREPYVAHSDPQTYPDADWVPRDFRLRDNFGPVSVPPNHYFAMGDNRDDSFDGRYWGFVPRENMVGEPIFIHWSYDAPTEVWLRPDLSDRLRDDWSILTHFLTRTRWSRMGNIIHNNPGAPE